MDVLLTNDDGIHARGLMALYTALRERGHTVHVVAPMEQQSGVGHSLTVFEPLRCLHFKQPGFEGLGLYGTPTDCVKLALASLLEKRPDLVMSGINAGPNVGPDILYSGTVGAATEACHEDLPSMAISDDEQECIGILSANVYFQEYNLDEHLSIRSTLLPPVYVEEDETLDDAFDILNEEQTHMALVKGKDGKIVGLVTMDDLLSELVGKLDEIPTKKKEAK